MKQLQMKAKEAFIFNLKHIMYVNDLTGEKLGDKIGVSRQQISNMLRGTSFVSESTLEKLAKVLKIEETDLFDPQFQDRYKKKVK